MNMESFLNTIPQPSEASVQDYISTIVHSTGGECSPFYVFFQLCTHGYLSLCQNVYAEHLAIIDLRFENDLVFRSVCTAGQIDVAKWLLSSCPELLHSPSFEDAFRYACGAGKLVTAQWLLTEKEDIDITAKDEYAFTEACVYGHLDVAKWLYSLSPNPSRFLTANNYIIKYCCEDGQLSVVKWIASKCPDVDFHCEDDYAFRNACQNGQLQIVEWLLQNYPPLDIHGNNDYCFVHACMNGHYHVAKLLYEVSAEEALRSQFKITEQLLFLVLSRGTLRSSGSSTKLVSWLHTHVNALTFQHYVKSQRHGPNDILNSLCYNGDVELAQWCLNHLDVFTPEYLRTQAFHALQSSCGGDNLEFAKWWYHKFVEGRHRVDDSGNVIFYAMCYFGYLDVAKWLYELAPDMTILPKMLYVVCRDNNVEFARWILSVRPSIDFTYQNHIIFRSVCADNHIALAHLFTTLCPHYSYETDSVRLTIVCHKIHNYQLVYQHRELVEQSTLQDNSCVICSKSSSIKTHCKHYYCQHCMTQMHLHNLTNCAYCTRPIEYLIFLECDAASSSEQKQ